uniref:Phosphatase tensin-type domain-containing protein n=1 Tax=Macrostomum lignano TaxID=282301 RepID=A0A1I8GAG5_9PLAT
MARALRQMVSKKKKRFTEDDFNLDLSYITPQIIAMGVPADTLERLFRNNIDEVVRCVERTYDSAKFQGRVEQFPMRDHNPPPIHIIPSFCESVYNWLKKGTDYVAAIHCKAGKGVTIPSQRRYVFYYAHMLHKQLSLKPCRLLLTSVLVENGLPAIQSGCCMLFKCRQMANCQDGKSKYVTIGEAECGEPRRAQSSLGFCIRPPAPIPVCGDFKLVFYNRGKLLARLDKLFHCWLNTFFVVNQPPDTPGALRCPDRAGLCVTLTKGELDRACKDTQHRVFPEGF